MPDKEKDAKVVNDDIIVFINQKDMKDMVKYPLLESPPSRYRKGSVKEVDMTLKKRKEARRNIIPTRILRVKQRHPSDIRELGQGYVITSETAFTDLQNQLIFNDEKGEEVNFLTRVDNDISDLPSSVNDLIKEFQKVVKENAELKGNQGSPSNVDEIQIKKDFYKKVSGKMFVGFKEINSTLSQISKFADELGKTQKTELLSIKSTLNNGLIKVKKSMKEIQGEING